MIIQRALDWLYPGQCLLCHCRAHQTLDLCAACQQQLPFNLSACPQCAQPQPIPTLCAQCRVQPPAFQASQVPFLYQFPLAYLLKQLKFHHKLSVARLMGQLLALHLQHQDQLIWPDCIIPVPLHPTRLRQRGFNQSLEIARCLNRALPRPIPIDIQHCHRIRETAPQAELAAHQRQANVRHAFQVQPDIPAYQRVAIVDDVLTTGHTVNALSNALLAAGIPAIEIWACARTGL